MPNPIPRNRSARGSQPRRSTRLRLWPTVQFRRLRENNRQPGPPPPQPHRPARHRAAPDLPLWRPQENNRQPGPPSPPRPPTRHRASASLPFRRLRENIRQLAPPTIPRRASTHVVVGVVICIVAAFVVSIALPLLPWGTSSGPTAAPPKSGSADGAAADRDDSGSIGGQLAAGPDASAGLDRGSAPEGDIHHGLSGVHRGVGFLVAGAQPGPAAQPAPPGGSAKVADLGQQGDPPAVGQPGHAGPIRRPEPQAPPGPPRVPSVPGPTPSGPKPPEPAPSAPKPPQPAPSVPKPPDSIPPRERFKQLADQLAKLPRDRNAPKATVHRPAGKAASPRQEGQTQSGASGPKHVNPGSKGASPRSGPSR